MDAVTDLSVVVPVYNEGGSIERLISDLGRHVVPLVPATRVIVVDDASTDETGAILQRLAAELPWLQVERAPQNQGHGASVLRGLGLATGAWIFQIDSDGQFLVRDFPRLWERREDCDLVLGIRVDRQDPPHRLVLSRAVRMVVSLIARRRLSDPNIPFRVFRRTLWDDLEPFIGPDTLAPSIHVVLGAALRGWRIEEVPVTHLARAHGTSGLRRIRLIRFSLRGLAQLVSYRYALARSRRSRAAVVPDT